MNKKYRPYFTLDELKELLNGLHSLQTRPSGWHTISYLERYIQQIESEHIAPAIETQSQSKRKAPDLGLTELKLLAYKRWLLTPANCNSQEIARAQMYRYENDLMLPEEEQLYEKHIDTGY